MSRHFIKNIIFSKTPLDSCYRFGDEFQIYPISIENAPQSPHTKHFPLIIEFTVDEKDIKEVKEFDEEIINESVAKMTAQTNKLIQLTNLLSTVSNYRFFFYRHAEMRWSVPLPDELTEDIRADFNKSSSNWSMLIYVYENMWKDLQITEFSKPDFPSISLVPQTYYYYYDPIESKKKSIDFPITTDKIFENYFSLNSDDLKIINSGMHQFSNGLDLFSNMKSLSFFSFVSSIETLIHIEFKGEKLKYECNDCKTLKSSPRNCQKCGRPIWGISAKFREFLFKYVSNHPEARKIYNKIYSIRSKITHTEYLINGDNFTDWEFNSKTEEIRMLHLQVMQISRRSFANWLTKNTE
jgi:hypothetical protein